MDDQSAPLATTPLAALHREQGARMVPFAGYAMPLHYAPGILAEHLHARAHAALFDVSHMGQATLSGPGAAAALERLTPADLAGLPPGRQRYALLTAEDGGILDDFMAARTGPGSLFLVVNASRKAFDFARIAAALPRGAALAPHQDRALLALQGPEAGAVLSRIAPGTAAMRFMDVREAAIPPAGQCRVSRSGYTGEDGFEISVPADRAEALARRLLAEPEVQLAGLGARDSLRLEAGLPLYGSDLDETTSPVEAGLAFAIARRRRDGWDFPGAAVIRGQLTGGPSRRLAGICPLGRAPARAGTVITDADGTAIGAVTSGLFAPSLDAPAALGYVAAAHAAPGTPVGLLVRGRTLPGRVVSLPFVPHRYAR